MDCSQEIDPMTRAICGHETVFTHIILQAQKQDPKLVKRNPFISRCLSIFLRVLFVNFVSGILFRGCSCGKLLATIYCRSMENYQYSGSTPALASNASRSKSLRPSRYCEPHSRITKAIEQKGTPRRPSL